MGRFTASRRRWGGHALILGVLLVALAAPARAQQSQGSIIGQVKDESGGVVPGVTVTVTSPALQVPSIVVVTNERGDYRVTPLPIGTYQVVYELAGFQTLRREELRLTAGFVARGDVVLKLGELGEHIIVTGSPVIDTTSTAIATQFTREMLESTPTGRNGLFALGAQLPAVRVGRQDVDVGGSLVGDAPDITVQGQRGDNWVVVEGVSVQPSVTENQSATYFDYSSLEEVRAEVVGSDVEAVRRGLKLTMIFKSGGNEFHGGAQASYTNDRFQGDNLNDTLRAKGLTRGAPIVRRHEVSGDFGGRIIRDKLWFFGSANNTENLDKPFGGLMPDGSPAIAVSRMDFMAAKLSLQASRSNRIIGFTNYFRKRKDQGIGPFVPYGSHSAQDFDGTTSKVEWQGVRGSSFLASLQFGVWEYFGSTGGHLTGKVSTFDQATQLRLGDPPNAGGNSWQYRYHTKGKVSWFKPGLFKGDHEFKTGFEYMDITLRTFNEDRGATGNYVLVFQNGVPFQLRAFNYPSNPRNPVKTFAAFLADSWTVSRKLTLNLGLRYSRDNGAIPETCRPASTFAVEECFPKVQFPIWHSVAPRLHAAYDVKGNGRTAVKAGWSRYPQLRGSDELRFANKADSTTAVYRWSDLDRNRDYTPGEINLDPNGPDFVSLSGGVANLVPNPDETQPINDEFMVAFEQQVMWDVAVRVAGTFVRKFDVVRLENIHRPYGAYNIPVTSADPGRDGVVGTADDPGTTLTYYEYPASLRGRQFELTRFTHDPDANETYKSIDLSATKRMSHNWQLSAGYSATKKGIRWVTNAGGGNDYPLTTLDPNAEINTGDRTWEWQGGVSSAVALPYQVMLAMTYQHRSGVALARTVLLRGGSSIPSLVVLAEPVGSYRLDHLNMVDLRIEKNFRLVGNHQLAVRLNVFNATNAGTILSANAQAGANFLRPTAMLRPRIVAFNTSYRF